ncbi:MAG: Gfo/Idh/MocA family protein [Candidatus Hodarchaeota archaeon]
MHKLVNMAVAGAGYWGKNHLRILNELGTANLVCTIEKDLPRAKQFSRMYHIDYETSFDSAMTRKDIDGIIIATPNSTHFQLASKAIEHGKHVLVEKPMCLSSGETAKLIDLAEENSVVLMAGHTFSFNSAVLKLKEIIDKGELGDIYFILCSRLGIFPPRPDSGVILDLAIHDIDIVSLLVDRQLPITVTATGKSYLRQLFEEIAFITLEHENDVVANLTSSWLTPAKIRSCWISGTERTAYIDLRPQTIEIFEQKIDKVPNSENNGLYDLITKEGMSYKPLIKAKEPLKEEDAHFIECIKNGNKPKVDGEIALKTVLVAEAAMDSLRNRKQIEMDNFVNEYHSYLRHS